jgi:hypothetical protein
LQKHLPFFVLQSFIGLPVWQGLDEEGDVEDGEGVGACGEEEGTCDKEEDDAGERVDGAGVLECTELDTLSEDCTFAEGLEATVGVEVACTGVEVTLTFDPTQAK